MFRRLRMAAVLACLLPGCALITKGLSSHVDVAGPRDAVFTRLDTVPLPLPVEERSNGRRYVTLPSKRAQMLVASYRGRHDTLFLPSDLNAWYIGGNIAMLPLVPFNLIADGVTGAWYDFGDAMIAYVPDGSGPADAPGYAWRVVPERAVYPRTKLGLTASVIWGITWPVIQTPLLGNRFGVGLAYRIHPDIDVQAAYEYGGCTDLSDYTGAARVSTASCDMTLHEVHLGLRYYPFNSLVLTASGGAIRATGTDVVRADGTTAKQPFGAWSPELTVGGGVLFGIGSLEYRRHYGLRRIVIDADGSAGLPFFETGSIGLNVTF